MNTNTQELSIIVGLTPAPAFTTEDVAAVRKGITDARHDFARLYDFFAGNCDTEQFTVFLGIGEMYCNPLTRKAWNRTIFKEIARIEATFSY